MRDLQEIRSWQRLDARTTTSGLLKPDDIGKLSDCGVRHVINLAPDDKPGALEGEAEMIVQHGIRYTYIPVLFDAPSEDHYREFQQAYDSDAEQVHVHCVMNYRVSAFFYRYNRVIRGLSAQVARSIMEQQWKPEEYEHGAPWAGFVAACEG